MRQDCKAIHLEVRGKNKDIVTLIDKFGEVNQLFVVVEEMGELISAIEKVDLIPYAEVVPMVLDEIADGYISMQILEWILSNYYDLGYKEELDYKVMMHEKLVTVTVRPDNCCEPKLKSKYISKAADSIRAISKYNRNKCDEKLIQAALKAMYDYYSVLRYARIRFGLSDSTVLSRIDSKLQRIHKWAVECNDINDTNKIREVRRPEEDING